MSTSRRRLIVTCEHASCRIPAAFAEAFADASDVLRSHRGWDPGALELAKYVSRKMNAPLWATRWTRLLVEVNRSLKHPKLFSEFTKKLPAPVRQTIIDRYYQPHRDAVTEWIHSQIDSGCAVYHIGVHSFTPVLNGQQRRCHVGLLYDPRRHGERKLCARWQKQLQSHAEQWTIRLNYPYRGTSDGFTRDLRREFAAADYCGIELEVNQSLVQVRSEFRRLLRTIAETLRLAWDDDRNHHQR